MEIGNRTIGDGVYFIAEAGVNHNGRVDLAEDLIEAAAGADADAVKFQTFSTNRLVVKDAPRADYQSSDGDSSQYEMLSNLELSRADHERLIEYAGDRGITFLSTPFDRESLVMLEELGAPAIKLGSGELNNLPLLRKAAKTGLPIVLSTGMGTMAEVETAYKTIMATNPGTELALLHCVSEYPASIEDVNLRVIGRMAERFDVPVGFSDHTMAIETPGLAVSSGATIIEKHLTLDRTLPGPDHEASLEPQALSDAVEVARMAARARGDGEKAPTPGERENRSVVRKSLYAAEPINEGDVLTEDNITVLRPAKGLSPAEFENVLGRTTAKAIEPRAPITVDCLEEAIGDE
ncbi:N-acetylneuraminate synthase [Halomicrobium sp. IBSBa]|uniref:N-acetylneuraminate synthase n=1 Tax=Halomicrobium sp. IBSBa TaxID=2778916 RepID=UPI001ABEFC50|nr:N-acetylneuraminate synthase [Halomicrobium sp. IBSBa]MBO4249537.1 N-acetylneuraminate synthase [Halomicrobium sp. IBSBa]